MIDETYMNKQNRDQRAKELTGQGIRTKKGSVRNQRLHPMYIKDYTKVTGHELTQADKGFGNTLYQTFFSAIYTLVEIPQ